MVAEHRAVVAAVADADADEAEHALRHHLRMVLSSLPRSGSSTPTTSRRRSRDDRWTQPPGCAPAELRSLYELMVLIRVFETEAERQYKAARIGGYCHLSSGQEATTVGAVHALQPDDLLVTGYRCHGFALARGVSPEAVMAELFGRADGCAHGRGGSMHLLDVERGFYGGWGIVAGQLPVATGLALALVRQGKEQAVLCELGDGAVNMGAWHESLNLAALWHLPIVFLVVNNGYGMGTSVDARVGRAGALPARGGLPDARRARRRRRPRRGHRGGRPPAAPRPRAARAGGARGDDLPLPRPLGRRRRPRLPHQGRDRRAPGARPDRPRARRRCSSTGVSDDELDAIDTRGRRARRRPRSRSPTRAPSPTSPSSPAACYAPGSGGQFERMRPGSPFGEEELVFDAGLGA